MDITVERFEDFRLIQNVAVLGAGNGGKAVAADLALQGLNVRLFEWAEYRANIAELLEEPVIQATGVVEGEAELSLVTTDLAEAIEDAEVVIACLQGLAHARLANELAPIIRDGAILVLNPGSTGGPLKCGGSSVNTASTSTSSCARPAPSPTAAGRAARARCTSACV